MTLRIAFAAMSRWNGGPQRIEDSLSDFGSRALPLELSRLDRIIGA
jgi:hypothetical protein